MFQFVYSNSRDSSSFSFSIFYSKNFKKCSFISSVTYIREFSKFEKYFNLVQNSKKKYVYIFVATLKNINKFHKYRFEFTLAAIYVVNKTNWRRAVDRSFLVLNLSERGRDVQLLKGLIPPSILERKHRATGQRNN